MMNMKKTLALLLATVMVLGMFPFGAMAEETVTCTCTPAEDGTHAEDCALYVKPEAPAAEEPKQEQPVCTCTPAEDGTHAETCALYAAPVTPASEEPKQETPVCTCTPSEDGTHAEDCALYEKPQEPKQEQPTCTCTPAEDGTHAETCALYEKPEAPVCTCTPAEDGTHAETCALYEKPEAPVCTCTPAEDGTHAETCALYEKPEEPVCTCTPVDGVHVEGCALYEEPKPAEPVPTCAACGAAEGHTDACLLNKLVMFNDGTYAYAEIGNDETAVPAEGVRATVRAASLDESGVIWFDLSYDTIEEGLTFHDYHYAKASDVQSYTERYYGYTKVGPFMPAVTLPAPRMKLASPRFGASPVAENNQDKGLVTSKVAEKLEDGSYKITIEAYAKGEIKTETVTTSTPCDIVLVLDLSSSMDFNLGNKTRLAALKPAVQNFIDAVGEQYNAETSDHRIAIVTYHGSASTLCDWTFADANNTAKMKDSVGGLNTGSGTKTDSGMELAKELLVDKYSYNGANTTRQKVAVLFTDGVPTVNHQYSPDVFVNAVKHAKDIKDAGATVYSVAVYNAASPEAVPQTSFEVKDDTTTVNALMQAISSNYPNATAEKQTSSGGGGYPGIGGGYPGIGGGYPGGYGGSNVTVDYGDVKNDGYYMTAATAEDLNNIFVSISNNIQSGSSSTTLGSSAVVKDIVSPYFQLPDNTTDITVQTVDCTGFNGETPNWDTQSTTINDAVSIDNDNKTINVTGFDFSGNFVASPGRVEGYPNQSGNFYGRKLVITFTVKPNDDFLGGDGVITNGAQSGIYDAEGKAVVILDQPEVNVPLKTVGVAAVDQNIYLGTAVNLPKLAGLGDYTVGDNKYTVDGVNNAYVDIVYTVKDYENHLVGTYKIEEGETTGEWTLAEGASNEPVLYEDKTYYVTCTVTSVNDNQKTVEATNSGKANVFVPVITFKDTAINLGELAVYADNGGNVEKWVHESVEANGDNMNSNAPNLSYAYSPEADKFTEEREVKVTVKIGEQDVSQYVQFFRDKCTAFESCSHKDKAPVQFSENRVNFVVHVKSFNLTIEKKGVDSQDGNAPFVFRVSGKGVDMNVVIYGNGSATIKGLPSGTYTVKETSGYWRYEIDAENSAKEQEVTANGPTATVTFVNKRTENKWLDDWAKATNKFNGSAAVFDSGIKD